MRKNLKLPLKAILINFAIVIAFASCEKETIYTGTEKVLRFSEDTVAFDTVFTTIGSATYSFKVYNTVDDKVVINSISLGNLTDSPFRLNVDGYSTKRAEQISLKGGDSLHIFVEVTIDPQNQDSPLFIKDSILFNVNNNLSKVMLTAYGQDVVKLKNQHLQTTSLTANKPYLVYDTLFVDKGVTVTLEAGATFYMHRGSRVIVDGTLIANGEFEKPILFVGDRLEDWYKDAVGAWGDIYLSPKSVNSSLNYVTIKNGDNGLLCDSVGLVGDTLNLSNLRIEHIQNTGLLLQNSVAKVKNSLFGNCSKNSVALYFGGSYIFTHCTISNSGNGNTTRSGSALYVTDFYKNDEGVTVTNPLKEAWFRNTIITGSYSTEIDLDFSEATASTASYLFQNCYLSLSKSFDSTNEQHYISIVRSGDLKFLSKDNFNYHIDSTSVARDAGDIVFGNEVPLDFDKVSRVIDNKPDLGMYEYVKSEKK